MSVAATPASASASGVGSVAVAYPAVNPENPSGAGDRLVWFVGYGNSAGAEPATPAGLTRLGGVHGGAGAWGLKSGPRGLVIFERESTGSESGTLTITNGGTGTDRMMRVSVYRVTRLGLAWEPTVVATDDDPTLDVVFALAPGNNPGGVAGDLVLAAGVWANSDANLSGGATSLISWPGAVGSGQTSLGATGTVTSTTHALRLNSYHASASGVATGIWSMTVPLTAAASGVGALVRLRSSGRHPAAETEGSDTSAESAATITLDGSKSDGNLSTYQWQKETSPGTWADVAGSGAVRQVTAGAHLADTEERYRLRVTDTGAQVSDWVTHTVTVLAASEVYVDAAGTLRPSWRELAE